MGVPAVAALMVVSAAASAYSAKVQARNQARMAKYNRRVAEIRQADALQRGAYEEYRQREQTRALIGHQRALLAGSGASLEEGAPALIIEDTLVKGEMDALTIRNNAYREAWGYQTQAQQYGLESLLAKQEGNVGAVTSLIGGATQAAAYYNTNK